METPWIKVNEVMNEADVLESLIQLKMESPEITREEALEWAMEMVREYPPGTELTIKRKLIFEESK